MKKNDSYPFLFKQGVSDNLQFPKGTKHIHIFVPESGRGYYGDKKIAKDFVVVFEGRFPEARLYSSEMEISFWDKVKGTHFETEELVSFYNLSPDRTTIVLSNDAKGNLIAPWGMHIKNSEAEGKTNVVLARLGVEPQKRYLKIYNAGKKLGNRFGSHKFVIVPNHVNEVSEEEENSDGRVCLGTI